MNRPPHAPPPHPQAFEQLASPSLGVVALRIRKVSCDTQGSAGGNHGQRGWADNSQGSSNNANWAQPQQTGNEWASNNQQQQDQGADQGSSGSGSGRGGIFGGLLGRFFGGRS